ncbi:MAG TPA: iron ABC transporter permease [Gemmatimonadaceae bacterium]|nr:iron ABC transporter permease [Gemmatimonadaceae bacterium]
MTRRFAVVIGLAALLLAVAIVAGVALGTIPLAPGDVLRALSGNGDPVTVSVVRQLRLPRVALAALVGAALAMSGTALQATLRNPLAEPYLLGVSGGAAVGAVLAVVAGVAGAALLPLAAFAGAVAAVVVALLVARAAGGRADGRVLLMAGVVVGAFANAAIMVVLANAPADAIRNATWWMMGSVAGAEWTGVRALAVYVAAGGGILWANALDVDALTLGEEPAAALGVRVERTTRLVYLVSALLAAATVSAAGLVGFVGLVVPHLARATGLRTQRPLLAAAALIGGALVVAADVVARIALPPAELPLGAVTAIIGVPFFLARLRSLR